MTKSRHIRTRTGCLTCRIRRVKCDEKRPSCEKCTKTGRKCDGYPVGHAPKRQSRINPDPEPSSPKHQVITVPPRSLAPLPYANHEEKLSFEHFVRSAWGGFGQLAAPEFWRLVLQVSYVNPPVKHIALAIGSLNRRNRAPLCNSKTADLMAQEQFVIALRETQHLIRNARDHEEVTTALVACNLFALYETLKSDWEAAHLHIQHGQQASTKRFLEAQAQSSSSSNSLDELELICGAFDRIDLQMRTYAPGARYKSAAAMPLPAEIEIPETFRTMDAAVNSLRKLWRVGLHTRWKQRGHMAILPMDPNAFAAAGSESAFTTGCRDKLFEWQKAFTNFRNENITQIDSNIRLRNSCLLTSIYHQLALLLVGRATSVGENAWDTFSGAFHRIVGMLSLVVESEKAESNGVSDVVISFESVTVPALYLVAVKCREPRLRRRCISLLEKYDRWEGIWRSRDIAQVIRRIMEYEESKAFTMGVQDITTAADIPEEARVTTMQLHTDFNTRQIQLWFVINSGSPPQSQKVPGGIVNI